jgi:hypothetical protein
MLTRVGSNGEFSGGFEGFLRSYREFLEGFWEVFQSKKIHAFHGGAEAVCEGVLLAHAALLPSSLPA